VEVHPRDWIAAAGMAVALKHCPLLGLESGIPAAVGLDGVVSAPVPVAANGL
jgi:hypothetical protein